jgi:hypothetical protein
MEVEVVGAGVGRTGTHSLKLALEQLLGAPCHHMVEVLGNPGQVPAWIDAIEGRPVDWLAILGDYGAIVDWPGGSFWPEITEANPDALVLLSVRDPESWYRSASSTIFLMFENAPPEIAPWMDAFERHNDAVRAGVSSSRLLEWNLGDGWDPICERLGVAIPSEPFPVTNSTHEFREMAGMPPLV